MSGGNFQPSRVLRNTNKGATHFEEMMIPLFVQKKNNFCKAKIRLGLIKDNLFHTLRVNIPEKK